MEVEVEVAEGGKVEDQASDEGVVGQVHGSSLLSQSVPSSGTASPVPVSVGENGEGLSVLPQPVTGEVEVLRLPGLDDVEPGQLQVDAVRSLRMQAAWEDGLPADWRERYHELMRRFGRWELAALVLWSSLPKELRRPKTQRELAVGVFGLASDRKVCDWKRLPGVESAIIETRASALLQYIPDVFRALGELATTADYRNIPAMRLALEMAGYYTPKQDLNFGLPRWISEAADEVAQAETAALAEVAGIPEEE